MKNKISKIIGLLVIFLLALTIKSFASYSSNDPSVKSGETFSITVKSSSKLESYDLELVSYSGLTYKGCSASGAAVNSSTGKVSYASLEGTSTLGTYTFKAPEVTEKKKYTVKFSINGTSNTSTVTVSPKTTSSSSSSNSSSSTSTQKPTFTSVNKKVYAKDTINLRSSWSTSSSAVSVKKGTEMTLTGTSSKAVNGYVWYRVTYNGATKYVSSSLVTTTKPADTSTDNKDTNTQNDTKSDNTDDKKDSSKATSTNLKSLNVTPTGLSPAFSAGTTEYTMTVGSNIDEIEINAVAEDSNASVTVEGNKNITIGNNKITITVTAGEDTKIYHINVTKENKKQLQLSELLVDGQPLNPEFDSNIYEYTIEKTNTAELNITATPSSSSAEVEILGNTDFQVGENIVTILVKSSNGEDVTTYQITVNVAQSDAIAVDEDNSSDNKKMYLYIGLGVVGVIILIIIIASVKNHKKDDVVEEVNLYNGMYNPRGNDEEDDTPSVDTNNLPKLDNEDLPKSLRKNDFEKKLEEKQNKMSERSKKIDEFYNTQDDNTREKRKGKHSK